MEHRQEINASLSTTYRLSLIILVLHPFIFKLGTLINDAHFSVPFRTMRHDILLNLHILFVIIFLFLNTFLPPCFPASDRRCCYLCAFFLGQFFIQPLLIPSLNLFSIEHLLSRMVNLILQFLNQGSHLALLILFQLRTHKRTFDIKFLNNCITSPFCSVLRKF